MKLAWILCCLWVLLLLVVGVVLFTEEKGATHGFKHPAVSAMDRGGSGLDRHEPLLIHGWLFGVLQISAFVGCLAFGARRQGRLGRLWWAFLIGGLLYVGVFTSMVLAYRDWIHSADPGDPAFWGPFPTATTLMLFGLWAMPFYFVVLYVVVFDRWIFTKEDLQKFEELVAARRRGQEDDS